MTPQAASERRGLRTAFGAFGLFWGSWAALLPAVRTAAGVDDGRLGLALAAVAVAALPAMPLAGRLADRGGRRLVPLGLAAFAVVVPLTALAHGPLVLVLALVCLGATTGFLDVVINTRAAAWERSEGVRVMAGCHGFFSLGVLVGSVLTGLAREAGAGPGSVLPGVALVLLVAAALQPAYRAVGADSGPVVRRPLSRGLLAIGLLVAASFLAEDALQSWSSLRLEVGLDAPPWVSGLGPGLFAGAMAAGRFASQVLGADPPSPRTDRRVLAAGGTAVGAGALLLALAPTAGVGLVGLVLAGAGTSVLAPTLLSAAGERSAPGRQGADLARVTTLGYVGFVTGPPVVGLVSGATSLPVALGLLSLVGVALAVGGPLVLRDRRVLVGT
jgi:MFS family permease